MSIDRDSPPWPHGRWTIVEGGEEVTGPVRPLDRANTREVNLVRSSWLKSIRMKPAESKFALMSDVLGPDDFWAGHALTREDLIASCEMRVASSDSGATVVGWACVEPPNVVHYVWVAEFARRRGVAKALLYGFNREAVVWCSHWTYIGEACRPKAWKRSFYKTARRAA